MKFNQVLIKSFYPLLFIACQNQDSFQTVNTEEMTDVLDLKREVATAFYPDINYHEKIGSIVVYGQNNPLVIAPNPFILRNFEHRDYDSVLNHPSIVLSKKFKDSTTFHFSSDFSTDSTSLAYMHTIVNISSYELTKKFIPDLKGEQDWSVMVLHELFHDYQRSFKDFELYGRDIMSTYNNKELLNTYFENEQIKAFILEENQLLIQIWKEELDLIDGLNQLAKIRSQRRVHTIDKFREPILEIENYQTTLEGHARFFECLAKTYLSNSKGPFENYSPDNDPNLELILNNNYWYALGYNTSRVLEKFHPAYRMELYQNGKDLNDCLNELNDIVLKFEKSIALM